MRSSALNQHLKVRRMLYCCVSAFFVAASADANIHSSRPPCILRIRGSSRCFAVPYTRVCIKTAAETEARRGARSRSERLPHTCELMPCTQGRCGGAAAAAGRAAEAHRPRRMEGPPGTADATAVGGRSPRGSGGGSTAGIRGPNKRHPRLLRARAARGTDDYFAFLKLAGPSCLPIAAEVAALGARIIRHSWRFWAHAPRSERSSIFDSSCMSCVELAPTDQVAFRASLSLLGWRSFTIHKA